MKRIAIVGSGIGGVAYRPNAGRPHPRREVLRQSAGEWNGARRLRATMTA